MWYIMRRIIRYIIRYITRYNTQYIMRAIFIFLFYSWETLEPTKLQREMENNPILFQTHIIFNLTLLFISF